MAGIKWSKKEWKYVLDRIKNGDHPSAIISDLNAKFKNKRTRVALEVRLSKLGISYQPIVEDTPIEDSVTQVREKRDAQFWRKRYSDAVKQLADEQEIIEQIAKHAEALPPAQPPKKVAVTKGISKEELVMLISDSHAGEVVHPKQLSGINEYNFDIACHRWQQYVNTTIDIAIGKMKGYYFSKLHALFLGDMVSGIIHEELLRAAPGNIMEWTVNYAHVLAQGIRELAQYFDEIEVVGIIGNHGRTEKKPSFKDKYVNYDYFLYLFVKAFLSLQKNVTCSVPMSFYASHEICGHQCLLLHGDNIKSYQGVPWYGINRAVDQFYALLNSSGNQIKYVFLGHFHTDGTLLKPYGRIFLNGSIKGTDEYSVGRMFTGSNPTQTLLSFHPKRHTFSFPIDLSGDYTFKHPYKYSSSNEADVLEEIRRQT